MNALKKYALWFLSALTTGAVCGLCGTVFSKSVALVTELRAQNPWLLFLLPAGGLLSVGIYKLCRVNGAGTTHVFDSARSEERLPKGLAFAVFCGTAISHLFGASAGREGAALQIGGGVADIMGRAFRFDERSRRITVMCGMAALFSAVFGTPLAAFVFVLEAIMAKLCLWAAAPVLVSSITAYLIAMSLGVHPERFTVGNLPDLSFETVFKTVIIVALGIVVAYVFCKCLRLGKRYAHKLIKNEFLRIALGGAAIVALTLLVGSYEYNGGGIDIIERTFSEGTVRYEAFALKLLFTVICVSAGYKGGEIIPTLFIGATFGGAAAILLGLPPGYGAAIGIAVLFCCATKCPIATVLMCCEMFGFSYSPIIIPVVILGFIAARYKGLYDNSTDIIDLIIKLIIKNKAKKA